MGLADQQDLPNRWTLGSPRDPTSPNKLKSNRAKYLVSPQASNYTPVHFHTNMHTLTFPSTKNSFRVTAPNKLKHKCESKEKDKITQTIVIARNNGDFKIKFC